MPIHAQEENLGQRCSVTFQIGPKSWQTSRGRITEFKGSLASPACGKRIVYRQKLALDNGGEVWLDLEQAEKEGRLQWLLVHQEVEDTTNVAQPPPNKKRKFDDEVSRVLRINTDILKDILPTIAGFVDPSDRCAMALAHSGLRNAVETHSKNCLATIIRDHAVDDTFAERIRDQTHLETSRTKPAKLPDRYLLAVAKKTPLYTLIDGAVFGPDKDPGEIIWGDFSINRSDTRLVFAEPSGGPRRASVHIYDLTTKACIQNFSFQLTNREVTEDALRDLWAADYFGDRFAVYTKTVIRLFTETGQLIHQVEEWGEGGIRSICGTATNKQYFAFENGIFSFDISSGAFDLVARFEASNDYEKFILEGICDGRWLVASGRRRAQSVARPHVVDLLVFDLKHDACKDDRKGPYSAISQCNENPSIFYGIPPPYSGEAHVLELDSDGKLSLKSTFSTPNFGSHSFVMNNFQRRIYLNHRDYSVQVVSASNGTVEGSLVFPGNMVENVESSGSEVFVGFVSLRFEGKGMSVAAFLPDQLM